MIEKFSDDHLVDELVKYAAKFGKNSMCISASGDSDREYTVKLRDEVKRRLKKVYDKCSDGKLL